MEKGGRRKTGRRLRCLEQRRIVQAMQRGGSVWNGGGSGREGSEVKKDTKARRKSLNDKRSGQLGLGRQGPKGAAG